MRLKIVSGVPGVERGVVECLGRDVLEHDAFKDLAVVVEGFCRPEIRPPQVQSKNFFLCIERGLSRRGFVSEGDHAGAIDRFYFDVVGARDPCVGEFLAFGQELLGDVFGTKIADRMPGLRARERAVELRPKRKHL